MGRKIRIISGLILFAFVACHLLNVSMGLHSIALMDRAKPFLMGLWTSTLGNILLSLALAAHFGLGLVAIYWRNTLRMSRSDTVQFVASLAIIPLLTPHVVGTAVAARYGIVPSYENLIPYFWIDEPVEGLRQVLLLAFLWVHGCIGVYTWARIQPWWQRVGNFLYPLAVAIPVLALLGFVEAGNQAIERFENPEIASAETVDTTPEQTTAPTAAVGQQLPFDEILAILKRINWTVFYVYLAIVAAVMIARQVRLAGKRQTLRIAFVDGPRIESKTGLNLLEIAKISHVPVANLCHGRARCGTCRVRIVESQAELSPMGDEERKTLERVGAGPGVRLACQLMPAGGFMRVERLVPPFIRPRDMHHEIPETAEAAASVA